MEITFCLFVIAFFLQCEIANTIKEIDCPDTMIKTNCPRCVECCDPEEVTTQPNCDLARGAPFPCPSSGTGRLRFCSCPEGWKWFNGSCVETCPEEECKRDGLVYHKCFNKEWQFCPIYLKTKRNESDCYPGCFCPEGFYHINDGRCLREPYCEIKPGKCRAGFEYSVGANQCRRMCSFVKIRDDCPPLALTGCFCNQGTYYSDHLNCCVEGSQC